METLAMYRYAAKSPKKSQITRKGLVLKKDGYSSPVQSSSEHGTAQRQSANQQGVIQRQLSFDDSMELSYIEDVDELVEWLITAIDSKDIVEAIELWLRLHPESDERRAEIFERTGEQDPQEEDDWSSDEGQSSQDIALDAIKLANTGRAGKEKQEGRLKQMDRLRHKKGRKAVTRATTVAVGEKTASQSTFAFGYGKDGLMVPFGTASSKPMDHFSQKHGGLPMKNTRTEYGDESHVHGEMGLLRRAILEGHDIKHVSVNKDFCPVCAAVLRAFGIGFTESYVRDNLPDSWTNPFDKDTESEEWLKAATAAKEACKGQNVKLANCD